MFTIAASFILFTFIYLPILPFTFNADLCPLCAWVRNFSVKRLIDFYKGKCLIDLL